MNYDQQQEEEQKGEKSQIKCYDHLKKQIARPLSFFLFFIIFWVKKIDEEEQR